ncbi:37S ribosomal protein S9, mitochondrial [Naganishia albida]|nr:37S ribosomal protein S9, mitochondrial [Naganishia albida]
MDLAKSTSPLIRGLTTALGPRRTYAAQAGYVPAGSYQRNRIAALSPRPKPALTTFFAGKPILENAINEMEDALKRGQDGLRRDHVFPLPAHLAVPIPRASWLGATEMSSILDTKLRTSHYRRVTSLLNQLAMLREIAKRAEQPDVLRPLQDLLSRYERPQQLGLDPSYERPDGHVDSYGRSVSMGRRKESSAKVYMIKAKVAADISSSSSDPADGTDTLATSLDHVPTGEILINSLPIHAHFPRPSDRELILRPLRLTGLIGYYNIFALTKGGGTSGQAGAVALAIARGVATHRPELREVLLKDGLLHRDPRMVERKKTGLAKARKRYTWVKR